MHFATSILIIAVVSLWFTSRKRRQKQERHDEESHHNLSTILAKKQAGDLPSPNLYDRTWPTFKKEGSLESSLAPQRPEKSRTSRSKVFAQQRSAVQGRPSTAQLPCNRSSVSTTAPTSFRWTSAVGPSNVSTPATQSNASSGVPPKPTIPTSSE